MKSLYKLAMWLICLLVLLTSCVAPSGVSLRDPAEPLRDIGEGIKRMVDGGLPIESIGLVGTLREIRAEDGSFVLTQTPTATIPFYSNKRGTVQRRFLVKDGWRHSQMSTVSVRVTVDGHPEPLYGRLAIFPAINTPDQATERFHARITVTPESLAQMEKNGTGFSCVHYTEFMQDWCDWALWISRSPIPQ